MAKINGVEGKSYAQLKSEIDNGGKFVVYEYCVSILIMTFKRNSDVYYIEPGANAVVKGLPFALLSLVLGWWGIPWGFIYTPMALFTNLSGGKNVTGAIMAALAQQAPTPQPNPDFQWKA